MKSNCIFIRRNESAMTLLEVFVVTIVLIIVAGICLPVFSSVSVKGVQTKALSNAKQVALALRLYASDHNGVYPSYTLLNGKPTATSVSDSNTAFAQLFPAYVTTEEIFWQNKSSFCTTHSPDDVIDTPPLDIPVNTLRRGENGWAYVVGLTDSSSPGVPLLANGFASPVLHTYTTDENRKGGLYKGVNAVVIRLDCSGRVVPVDQKTMTITGPDSAPGMPGDIFTTADSANGWLTPANVVVNPK